MHAPGLFDLDDGGHSVVTADPVPRDQEEAAYAAEAGCPEQAISVELAHAGQVHP